MRFNAVHELSVREMHDAEIGLLDCHQIMLGEDCDDVGATLDDLTNNLIALDSFHQSK